MTAVLGPFAVGDVIAEGGMGSVYDARHLIDGYDAALKIVPPNDRTRDALVAEVRATAALNHPGIVAIYDYGEVTQVESLASERFADGSLWFAMERATEGTLERVGQPLRWSALRRLLLELLDALAHAHARGCIHRDLKPANILVTRRHHTLSFLLADFGIALMSDAGSGLPETTDTFSKPAAGTPQYMAPEQVRGQWRDIGPWTDLYALACVAWELACGAPLFERDGALQVAMAHLGEAPGTFAPRFTVPTGFEAWLRVLLQKQPHARFDRAASAAAGLARLGTVGDEEDVPPAIVTLDNMPTLQLPSVELRAIRQEDAGEPLGAAPVVTSETPQDWRHAHERTAARDRAGLGLFGLREIAVQGREQERDALWQTLLAAKSSNRVTVAAIEGVEGSGKSRLLQWLGVRADELGVATVLRARHARMTAPTSGLAFAIARHFGGAALEHRKLEERLRGVLDPADASTVAEALSPADRSERGVVRFGSPVERYRTLMRVLTTLARRRPVLVLLDDIQWASDTLGFLEFLLDQNPACPIAVVMSIDPQTLSERPLAARRIATIQQRGVRLIGLRPLGDSEHSALLQEQGGLASALADELVARSGDTNYSLCVLNDWVERNVLTSGPDGYVIARGAMVDYPADAHEAWSSRIHRFCARFPVPPDTAKCLGVAAVLGIEVDDGEWRRACELVGGRPHHRLVSELTERGFVRTTEVGFEWTHEVIASALVRQVQSAGAAAAIHSACATAIEKPGANGASVAERRGLHLLRAEALDDALDELRVALDIRVETSAYDEAIAIADQWLAATTDPTTERALVVRARRADALRFRGEVEAARGEARELLRLADEKSSALARAEGLRVLAGIEQAGGRLDEGIDRYSEAIDAFGEANDDAGVAKCRHGRGWLRFGRGEVTAARSDFESGVALATHLGADSDAAWSRQGLAEVAVAANELDLAQTAAERALGEFEALGSRSGQGMALATLGHLHRARGETTTARHASDTAIALLASLDSPLLSFALAHRVVLEHEVGEHAELRSFVDRALSGPMPPTFEAVVTIASLKLEDVDRASILTAVRETWEAVCRHPLVQVVAERQRADLEELL